MAADAFRCADSSDARDEPLFGTASFVRRWLLLEQPGSWGRDALVESRLPERGAMELRRRARAAGIRVVLIRRGVRLSSARRQCYFVVTEPNDSRLSRITLEGFDDLLDVDLAPLADGGAVEGAVDQVDPLFLVCTHGRHDACCSIRGNQVSRLLCAEPGFDAWECSHIGGDRFAANLVCFPHGVYYGRVGPADVLAVAAAYRRGALSLPHYRGRCSYPFPVQAAEYFARRELGSNEIDDLSLIETSPTEEGLSASFSIRRGGTVDVRIRCTLQPGTHRLTCNASRSHPIPRYELLDCVLRGAANGDAID